MTIIQFPVTVNWGISNYDNYNNVGYWKSYSIPVGDFYTGNFNRMIFVMDEDAQPSEGTSFFTNIQIYEGTSCALIEGLSGAIGAVAVDNITDVNVYPNPAVDKVNLSYQSAEDAATSIEIFTITGARVYAQSVRSQVGSNIATLNVGNFDNGTYLIRIVSKGDAPVVKKLQIIKN